MSDPHTISEAYRALNWRLLRSNVGYGNGGARHAECVMAFIRAIRAKHVLDYGAGRGMLARELGRLSWRGRVYEYDPCVPLKAKRPKPRDLVVCTDVLEHVEPECLDAVLADLKHLSLKGCYLTIATRVSNKRLRDGRNAHLIVESPHWWLSKLVDVSWPIYGAQVVYRKHTDDARGVRVWLEGGRG